MDPEPAIFVGFQVNESLRRRLVSCFPCVLVSVASGMVMCLEGLVPALAKKNTYLHLFPCVSRI